MQGEEQGISREGAGWAEAGWAASLAGGEISLLLCSRPQQMYQLVLASI